MQCAGHGSVAAVRQSHSLADVQLSKKKKKEKTHLMLRSFWHSAAVCSVYTSIIVYCTHKSYHRLLDSVMEGIKYNN